ncbi:hypothetical protein PATSB16_11910 [Pandoraea thiooxydans]|nr:hypothetical protein PATSB16_11910 [Pandoraea thiooxydans]
MCRRHVLRFCPALNENFRTIDNRVVQTLRLSISVLESPKLGDKAKLDRHLHRMNKSTQRS